MRTESDRQKDMFEGWWQGLSIFVRARSNWIVANTRINICWDLLINIFSFHGDFHEMFIVHTFGYLYYLVLFKPLFWICCCFQSELHLKKHCISNSMGNQTLQDHGFLPHTIGSMYGRFTCTLVTFGNYTIHGSYGHTPRWLESKQLWTLSTLGFLGKTEFWLMDLWLMGCFWGIFFQICWTTTIYSYFCCCFDLLVLFKKKLLLQISMNHESFGSICDYLQVSIH